MERRLSYGSASAGINHHLRRVPCLPEVVDTRGSAVNFPGNLGSDRDVPGRLHPLQERWKTGRQC